MTQRYGVYGCVTCGAMTMRPDADVPQQTDPDDRDDQFDCALVRDTHSDDHDVCHGTVVFRGFIDLDLGQP